MNDDDLELLSNRIGEIRDAADRVVPLLERIAVALERLIPARQCYNCGHPEQAHLSGSCRALSCLCGKFV